uniref:Uncharacterized protein n=1 Tax=Sphaerodactylus townsendi TaxID=933632 RepID=A0ACB8FT19_9SAUR
MDADLSTHVDCVFQPALTRASAQPEAFPSHMSDELHAGMFNSRAPETGAAASGSLLSVVKDAAQEAVKLCDNYEIQILANAAKRVHLRGKQ